MWASEADAGVYDLLKLVPRGPTAWPVARQRCAIRMIGRDKAQFADVIQTVIAASVARIMASVAVRMADFPSFVVCSFNALIFNFLTGQ